MDRVRTHRDNVLDLLNRQRRGARGRRQWATAPTNKSFNYKYHLALITVFITFDYTMTMIMITLGQFTCLN